MCVPLLEIYLRCDLGRLRHATPHNGKPLQTLGVYSQCLLVLGLLDSANWGREFGVYWWYATQAAACAGRGNVTCAQPSPKLSGRGSVRSASVLTVADAAKLDLLVMGSRFVY
jgi:hypothetical protein